MRKIKETPIWVIVLLIIGTPLWLPVVVALATVVFSLYISLWGIIVALWAVDISLFLVGVVFAFAVVVMLIKGSILSAIIYAGLVLILLGIGILGFVGCVYASKGLAHLSVVTVRQLTKSLVARKEKEV